MSKTSVFIMEDPMVLECKTPDIHDYPEDAPPKKTILEIWKDFGMNTTMHGIGHAINGKRTWKRVFWAFLVLASTCFAFFSFYQTIDNYLSYPVVTTVELKFHREMTFPAVTFCNLNPAKYSQLNKRLQDELNKSTESNFTAERTFKLFQRLASQYQEKHSDRSRNMYYTLDDMLVDCQFFLDPCDASDFIETEHFMYGKCFSFNTEREEPLTIRRPGNLNGLILEMDIKQDEYLPFVGTTGVKVLVHSQSEMPFPEDSGIIVGAGRATSIGIRRMASFRQPPPWGQCLSENRQHLFSAQEFKYTAAVCEKTCYQKMVIEECHCCDDNYSCDEEILRNITDKKIDPEYFNECDESDKSIMICVNEQKRQFIGGTLECIKDCRPSCEDVTYRTNYATGSWPTDNFIKTFINKIKRKKRNKSGQQKPLNDYPDGIASEFVSKNFLRVEVYFENFVEDVIQTSPAYDWSKLVSDIGGQIGLWLGFSIMTATEILELLFDIGSLIFKRIQGSRKMRTSPKSLY